ncbi:hypothetical protein ABIB40_000872 [Pedobacter sp. UYP30]
MDIHANFVGKNFCSKLVAFAISLLKTTKVGYIWCDARAIEGCFCQKRSFNPIQICLNIENWPRIIKRNEI